MQPVETVEVDDEVIACEGGPNPALGHPRIFLNMQGRGEVDCPYCGRRFVLNAGTKVDHGH